MIEKIQIGKAYMHKKFKDIAIVVSAYEKGFVYYQRLDQAEMQEHCIFYKKLLECYEEYNGEQ